MWPCLYRRQIFIESNSYWTVSISVSKYTKNHTRPTMALMGTSLNHCVSALVTTEWIHQLHYILAQQFQLLTLLAQYVEHGFLKWSRVCLSIRLSHRSTTATAAGGFATERSAGRSIAGAGDYCSAAMHRHNNKKLNTKTFRSKR